MSTELLSYPRLWGHLRSSSQAAELPWLYFIYLLLRTLVCQVIREAANGKEETISWH